MTDEFDVDLFVIGGGSGGVRAARIAAGYGARVSLAEEYRIGGTCVIRGCVPKKLMVYAGRFADEFEDAAGFGWSVSEPHFDWSVLKARRDAEVSRLESIYDTNLERMNVTIIPERAVIEDAHTIRLVASGRRVRAEYILVAVGAYPVKVPVIPGGDLGITSNEVLRTRDPAEAHPRHRRWLYRGRVRQRLRASRLADDPAAPGRPPAARVRRRGPRRPRPRL